MQDCPPRSAAQSLFFFSYARRLPTVMASDGFAGDRAWDMLAWYILLLCWIIVAPDLSAVSWQLLAV